MSKETRTLLAALGLALTLTPAALAGEATTALDWTLMGQTVDRQIDGDWRAVFPAEIERLDGKRVRVTGFVVSANGAELVLSAHKPGCTCALCTNAAASQFVLVTLAATAATATSAVTVEGTLELTRGETSPLYFTLRGAKVAPTV